MSLNLDIPGDPAAIRTAAEWLSPTLRDAVNDADIEMNSMVSDATVLWTGESGYAFNSAAQAVRRGNFGVPSYAGDVAEVLRAYAGRLERGHETFDGYAQWARDKGLTVLADVVQVPTTRLHFCPDPNGPESPELTEWKSYQDKVTDYQTLSEKVGAWWGELEVWISEQFSGLVAEIESLREADGVYEGLVKGNAEVVSVALTYAEQRQRQVLTTYREHAEQLQNDADTFKRQLRSGNPAVRAAAEAADPRAMRQGVSALNDMIDGVARTSKVIPFVGGAVDVVMSAAEIRDGGSPSSVGAGLLGGAIGGGAALAGLAAAGVSFPPLGVALIVGAAAWGVGEAATWAWEAWVPLDTRESFDAGIHEFLDFANPFNWASDGP